MPARATSTHGAEEAGIAGGFLTLAIACSAAGLRVDVHDGSGDLPLLESPLAEAETGRGLLLVETLSTQWGCYAPDGPDRKIVWAVCTQPGHEPVPGFR